MLQGQAVARNTQAQLRNLVFNTRADGTAAYQTLNDLGITFDKSGKLNVDGTKLSKALEADYAGVSAFVGKIGSTFKASMETMVGSSGSITSASDGMTQMIKRLGTQETQLSSRLTQIEARYRAQFTALDTMIAGMKQTSTYLTQQLANLPGTSSK